MTEPAGWNVLAGRLEERFPDKAPPLPRTEALREATRCLYCFDAPCIRACPTGIDIPVFLRKIASGNTRGAARTILSSNLLGASCARVCPVEVLCEGSCVYVPHGSPPIPIGRLQRYAMDHGASPNLLEKSPPTGRSVACVGAGPASLACAGTLCLLGHDAVVYEKRALPGGLNTTGVAPYKFGVGNALAEVELICSLGAVIRTGVEVGRDISGEELLSEHAAVFLGPGLGADSLLPVPGSDARGVLGATDWIRRVKTDPSLDLEGVRAAVVIGGGNTAVDAARELLGLGVGDVWIVHRGEESRMRAYAHELAAARAEGLKVRDRSACAEMLTEDGRVRAVRLVKTDAGRPTDRERGVLPADLVVLAIGQSRASALATEFPGVKLDERGNLVANAETFATGNPRVFAGGDARNGGREVVHAADEGQRAARSIDALLRRGGRDGQGG